MRFTGLILLVTLFAAPVFAQAPPAEKKSDPNNPKDSYEGVYRNYLFAVQQPPAADADKLRAELKKLEAELEKTLAETQKIKAQIEQVRARMKSAEQHKEGQPDALHLRIDTGEGPQEIILRKVDGAWKIVEGKKEPVPGTPVFPKAGTPVPPGTILGPGGGGPAPPPGYAPVRPDADKRIDNLEKKLDKLMELLEQMRKEMDGSRKKAGADAEAERAKAVEALNRIAEDKKNADLRELKRAEEAAKEKAEEAERKALRDQQKAVLEELKRVEELQRALEEARKKKADDNKKEKPRQE
jgi:DNA repair exonuclease SbcCD ATPase subunit